MKWIAVLLLAITSGCSINKLIPPPYAGAVIQKTRFFGLRANIPMGTTSVLQVQLGWGSEVWSLIPCSTNQLYSAPISDTFRLGQGLNPFATEIIEDEQTGWIGQPPTPRLSFRQIDHTPQK